MNPPVYIHDDRLKLKTKPCRRQGIRKLVFALSVHHAGYLAWQSKR
jgi:hypothetical protein